MTTAFLAHDDGLHPARLQPVENQRVTDGVAKGRKSPSVLPSFGVRKAVFRIAVCRLLQNSRPSPAISIAISCDFNGHLLRFQWPSPTISMAFSYDFNGHLLRFQWPSTAISIAADNNSDDRWIANCPYLPVFPIRLIRPISPILPFGLL